MKLAISVLAVAALARTAAAGAPTLTAVTGALPAGVKASASLEKAVGFTDKNGADYLLFSAKRSKRTTELFVDLWAVPAGGKPKLLRTVKELVEDCQLDLTAQFHDDALSVTDLDGDGYAEVTFGYEADCRSDVSPETYKLLLLENTDKYILRGHTLIDAHDPDAPTAGGDFTPEPSKGKWPAAFYKHATDLWTRSDADGTMPPSSLPTDLPGSDPGPRDPNEHRSGGNPCGG